MLHVGHEEISIMVLVKEEAFGEMIKISKYLKLTICHSKAVS